VSPRKPSLDDLVREARDERVPDVDWGKMEEPLFARVAAEARAHAAIAQYEGKRRTWVVGAMVLAVAASVPLFFAGTHDATLDTTAVVRDPSAGDVSWKETNAVVHVTRAGVAHDAAVGESVALGDVIEPKSGRVVFVRTEAAGGGVTWDAEDNARVEVRATRGTLVLALMRGAVEAQVAPVANGEAFAIDVEGTRIAVHGTHLRVAREGTRATIDLREGVVSIGPPPRAGSTYGDLVTAPAHVEFDSSDLQGTLKITHEATRVRAAAPLERPRDDARVARHERAPEAPPVTAPAPRPLTPVAPAPLAAAPRPSPVAPVPVSVSPSSASPASVVAPVPPPPMPPQVDPNPERTITDAVRACESTHVAQATGVVVTVRTSLELHVGDSGMVQSARFDPPLAPDVQQCAVRSIYGTRFSTPGSASIPIDFTR